MDYLKEYVYESHYQYTNIIDEYIHLEMLCKNTHFYDIQKFYEAIIISEQNQFQSDTIYNYYWDKIDEIKKYFEMEKILLLSENEIVER